MKKKLSSLLFFTLILLSCSYGQQKQLTLEQAVIGRWQGLAPENMEQLQWIANTNQFSFIEDGALMRGHPGRESKKTILTLEELKDMVSGSHVRLRRFPRFTWTDSQTMVFHKGPRWFLVDPYEKKLLKATSLDSAAQNTDYCSACQHIAYTKGNNLLVQSFDGQSRQISHSKDKGIVYGQEVHRREFGIHTGTFWSPGGEKLAFYRKDERMVSDYPLVDIENRVAREKPVKYPMAGMESHHVRVGVYDMAGGDTLYLHTGTPRDQYLTNVQWGPRGRYIYIALLNRDQDHMKLNRYDAATGTLDRTLFEEKHTKYVEPLDPVTFVPNSPDRFVWMSRRDGYNHIYLYNTEGKLIRQLTDGKWEVTGLHGFDENGENLYFTSTRATPLERHLYSVNITSGRVSRLTSDPGYHRPQASASGSWIIDGYSSRTNPRTIQVLNADGSTARTLLRSGDPLKGYDLGEMTISTIKAADGETNLYYRLIKPSDFDPAKKYPAIVYVYGGPHAQLIQNRWLGAAGLWQHYMAQKGYVMLTVDNRGSAARGRAFENVIHRQLGKLEIADQMKGVKMLKSLGYVDSTRIGVHGWSYGGFMTTSLMLKKPDVFEVGVAGGPVIDWKYYEVMYGERYMDTPQDNPRGYRQANLKNYVSRLDGDLLLIQGYLDDIVVPQHSLSFLRECVKNNVQVDYFIYPRHQHGVGGRDRIHLMRKITRYFDEHL
jgi:dipeptidyl-peptidase-4